VRPAWAAFDVRWGWRDLSVRFAQQQNQLRWWRWLYITTWVRLCLVVRVYPLRVLWYL
jgi:hypothetical protein